MNSNDTFCWLTYKNENDEHDIILKVGITTLFGDGNEADRVRQTAEAFHRNTHVPGYDQHEILGAAHVGEGEALRTKRLYSASLRAHRMGGSMARRSA